MNDCKTCLVYIEDDESCPILTALNYDICPCKKCIVKVMCEDPCGKFNAVTLTTKSSTRKYAKLK